MLLLNCKINSINLIISESKINYCQQKYNHNARQKKIIHLKIFVFEWQINDIF